MRRAIIAALAIPLAAVAATPPIVEAAHRGDRAAAKRLVAEKVDVNAPGPDGATALHEAARQDDVEMARLLIEGGANVDVANRYGVRPLSIAAANGSTLASTGLVKPWFRAQVLSPGKTLGKTPTANNNLALAA